VSAEQHVLIVASDPREERVLTVSLKKAGMSVRAVSDALEALAFLERDNDIGVVIVELNLPRMDGFEFCERIRESALFDGIALVALSGSNDLATKLRAYESGYDELLTKPVFINEVAGRVELLLQRRARDLLSEAQAEELEGRLADITVIDLLQAIESGQKTGVVRVFEEGHHSGSFFFEEGEIIDAEAGRLRGAPALHRMMRWSDGRYLVKYLPTMRRRRRIRRSTSDLLSDGLERLERWNTIAERMPSFDSVYEVDSSTLSGELSAIPDEVRSMLRLFDGLRTLEQVMLDAAMGDLEALRVIERFMNRGQLRLVESAPEQEPEEEDEDDEDGGAVNDWLEDRSAPAPVMATQRYPVVTPKEPRPRTDKVRELAEAQARDEALALRAMKEEERRLQLEAERRDQERQRLEAERLRLREEQSAILAALARNEAQAARAQDDEARRVVEERRRRVGDEDEDDFLAEHMQLPIHDGIDEDWTDPETISAPEEKLISRASSIRDEVAAAFQQAERITAQQHLEELESDWSIAVRQHQEQYDVIRTHHVLKPMTLATPDADEVGGDGDRSLFDLARMAVSDVFDSVAHPEDDLGFDGHVRGPSQMETRPDLPPVEHNRQPRVSPIPGLPLPLSSRPKAPEPTPARAKATPIPILAPKILGPKEEPAAPRVEPAAPTTPTLTPTPAPAEPVRAEHPSGNFEDHFFSAEDDFDAKKSQRGGSSKLTLIFGALIVLALIGSIAYLLKNSTPTESEEKTKPVTAEQTDESDASENAQAEPADPFEAEDELTTPEAIDAEYKANDAAEHLIKTAANVAALMAGHPADTELAAVDDTEEPVAPVDVPPEVVPKDDPPKEVVVKKDPPKEVVVKKDPPKEVVVKKDPPKEVVAKKDPPKDTPPKEDKVVKISKDEPVSTGASSSKLVADGDKLFKKGKFKEAIPKFEAALAKDSSDIQANYLLGLCYSKTGNPTKALQYLENVRGARQSSAKYWKELGTIYIKLKKNKQGIEAYEKAVAILGPDSEDGKQLQKYIDSQR